MKREQVFDKNAKITNERYVVIDTELTGLNEQKDSIVSIGAVKMDGRLIKIRQTFHRLVKPKTSLTSKSIIIHKITPSEVEEKPLIDDVIKAFLDFCEERIIIGHFVSIDMTFINKEVRRVLGTFVPNHVLDTSLIYSYLKKKYPRKTIFFTYPGEMELYEMAKRFGIPCSSTHDALSDAFVTAQLFQRFIPMLVGIGISRIGDLLHIASPFTKDARYRLSGEIVNF
ncbi:MAG: 3'-5' exonuclease [Thermodesulfovibrionales bacterium]|nr:3'-5' exonuclease [Thermodesulfovibrionales bacterium]